MSPCPVCAGAGERWRVAFVDRTYTPPTSYLEIVPCPEGCPPCPDRAAWVDIMDAAIDRMRRPPADPPAIP